MYFSPLGLGAYLKTGDGESVRTVYLTVSELWPFSSIHGNVTEVSLSTHFFLSPFTNTLHYHHTNRNLQNLPVTSQNPLRTLCAHLRDAVTQADTELQQDTWSIYLSHPCPPTSCTPSCHCHHPACPHHHYLHGMLPELSLVWYFCFFYFPEGAGSGTRFPQHLMLIFQ